MGDYVVTIPAFKQYPGVEEALKSWCQAHAEEYKKVEWVIASEEQDAIDRAFQAYMGNCGQKVELNTRLFGGRNVKTVSEISERLERIAGKQANEQNKAVVQQINNFCIDRARADEARMTSALVGIGLGIVPCLLLSMLLITGLVLSTLLAAPLIAFFLFIIGLMALWISLPVLLCSLDKWQMRKDLTAGAEEFGQVCNLLFPAPAPSTSPTSPSAYASSTASSKKPKTEDVEVVVPSGVITL